MNDYKNNHPAIIVDDPDQQKALMRLWSKWDTGTHRGGFVKRLVRRDICAYCFGKGGTLDHIIPRNQPGGLDRNDPMNFAGACEDCNHTKADSNFLTFFQKIQSQEN